MSSTGKWLYGVLTGGRSLPEGSIPGRPEGGLSGSGQGSQSQSQTGGGQESQSQSGQGQSGAAAASAEDLNVTLQVVNSWESEGKYFYQYAMTVENVSDRTVEGWQADIVFNEAPELSDSWNGVFAPDGNMLHISSVDYNGKLESGGIAENIGFIVSGSANLLP